MCTCICRFTTDMEPLDDNIDKDGIQLLSCILDFFKVVLVMSFCLPQFLVIIPPVMMSYYFIQVGIVLPVKLIGGSTIYFSIKPNTN